jgi:hypothetical protein
MHTSSPLPPAKCPYNQTYHQEALMDHMDALMDHMDIPENKI